MQIPVLLTLTENSDRVRIETTIPKTAGLSTGIVNEMKIKIPGFDDGDRKHPPNLYPALEVGGVRGLSPDGGQVANVTPRLPGFNAPCRSPGRNEK